MFAFLLYAHQLDSLRTDAAKVVIVLDFTKFGLVEEGNVHSFCRLFAESW